MDLLLESSNYNIKVENFEGPLDLLCKLIEKNKMDIYDVSISEIADQYINYINSMQEMNLEITGEFLVMASNLLYIKSKLLLPKDEENEAESVDLEEELISKIIEYKKIKDIAEEMRLNSEKFSLFHYKEPEKITFEKVQLRLENTYEKDLIPSIFMKIANENMNKINHNAKDINRLFESEKITVRSKIKDILRGIKAKGEFVFNNLFNLKSKSKTEVVTAFMAMLELSRASKVKIEQEYNFGDIKLTKKQI